MDGTTQSSVEIMLAEANLRASRLHKGPIGLTRQVRQGLRCTETGRFVAFFCRSGIPAKTMGYFTRKARFEDNNFVAEESISLEQRRVAEMWLEYMCVTYPKTHKAFDHPTS